MLLFRITTPFHFVQSDDFQNIRNIILFSIGSDNELTKQKTSLKANKSTKARVNILVLQKNIFIVTKSQFISIYI